MNGSDISGNYYQSDVSNLITATGGSGGAGGSIGGAGSSDPPELSNLEQPTGNITSISEILQESIFDAELKQTLLYTFGFIAAITIIGLLFINIKG